MKRSLFILLLAAFGNGMGTVQTFAGESGEWSPSSLGPVNAWTAPLCEEGKFVLQPFIFYSWLTGSFDNDGVYSPEPEGMNAGQFQEQLFLCYGISNRVEVDLQAGLVQNTVNLRGGDVSGGGLTDIALFGRFCLLHENEGTPHVTGLAHLKFPTGKYENADPGKQGTDLTGSGSWDQGVGLLLTKKLEPFMFHADFIYNLSQETTLDGVGTRYGDYQNIDLAAEIFPAQGFNLMVEANGFLQGDLKVQGEALPSSGVQVLSVTAGVGWSGDSIQTLLGYQSLLAGVNADAAQGLVFSCVLTL